ncbi:MAG: SMC-Scp complex subunit ScpB [Bacteroidota bacterium]
MEISQIIPHIEVLIFASEKPLSSLDIVELINNTFGFLEERVMLDQVESALEGIREKYNSEFYPFEVKESGGGWQFLTKVSFHTTIAQLNGDKFLKRLSNAALETLAIIAYKQPITKGEIEAIRGVNSDYSIQKLLEKELVLISGRNENMPGKPLVYATSKNFMDYFGINSAADLPKIREVLAEQIVEGTIINPGDFTDQNVADEVSEEVIEEVKAEVSELTVNEDGELIIKDEEEETNSEETPSEESPEEGTSSEEEKGKEEAPE